MIRYALFCDNGHEFESWFPSSTAYEEQRESGLVSCPLCHSQTIAKQIMAPSIARTEIPTAIPSPVPPQQMTLLSEKEQQIRTAIKALRHHVEKNAENVGERFPEEARKMHDGETEARSIYGQASFEETKALIEEGIDILPLPSLPDDKN